MRRTIYPLSFLLFLVACTAEGPSQKNEEAGSLRAASRPIPVTALRVTAREVPLVIVRPGKTEASDRYEAKAPADIKIQKIFVEEGQRVEAGEPLIKFDDEEGRLKLAKARAELKEAEAAMDLYNVPPTVIRERVVEEEGGGVEGREEEVGGFRGGGEPGEEEMQEKRAALYQATAERARAEIDMYEHTSELTQLNSPISGTVTKRHVTEGTNAAEDQPLVEVVRLDPVRFVFTVPVGELQALEKGAEISVRLPSLPGQEFTGEIFNIGAEAQAESQGVEVKLNIVNTDLALKAEITGEVVVRTQAKKKIIPVVEAALVKTEKSTYVYKIEGNHVKKVAVELGEPYNGQPAVERGLAEGDLIVAPVEEEMKDGTLVEVQSARAGL